MQPVYPQMILFPKSGILCHFHPRWLGLIFICPVSFPRLQKIGTPGLHGPSMFAVKAKIYGVLLYNRSSSIAFDETSSQWSAQKAPNFSAFHWSPHGYLVSIGQHFVTTRMVHLPKRTETSLFTESDRSGPNRLCGPCIAAIAGFCF